MTAETFLDKTPLRTLLDIPPEVLDQAMAKAFCFYQAGCLTEAEILCAGLLAADHRYWWAYSLYAAVLRNQGRHAEALRQVKLGLRYEPAQLKLLAMRDELVRTTMTASIPPAVLGTATRRTRTHAQRKAA